MSLSETKERMKLGSSSIDVNAVYPPFVLDEIEKNKDWKFVYDKQDPMFIPAEKYARYKVRPVKNTLSYDLYKQGESLFWTAEADCDFGQVKKFGFHLIPQDLVDWEKMEPGAKAFIKKVLTYFLSADSGVGDNALTKFSRMFPNWQVTQFYLWQGLNEAIHSETYATALEAFITDKKELNDAFNAIDTDPGVRAKADLVIKWVECTDMSPHENLVAFSFTESVLFGGSFSSIGYLKQLGIMPGLTYLNDIISRDEGIHCTHSFSLYRSLQDKLPAWRVYQICCEFVEKEFFFIDNTLQVDLKGMNSGLLKKYIMFVADVTLRWLGYDPIYNVKNPLPWMQNWSVDGITSFFEKRNPEYSQITKRKKDHQVQTQPKKQKYDPDDF